MSARRLIAYVRDDASLSAPQFFSYVELDRGRIIPDRWLLGPRPLLIEAMKDAEKIAREQGYELDWRGGFVAHGVPVETSERGAQEA